MSRDKIIKLLKSGDFTVAYHDNGYCSIYRGKHEYDNLPKKEVIELWDTDGEGYLPPIVHLLCDALGGASETI